MASRNNKKVEKLANYFNEILIHIKNELDVKNVKAMEKVFKKYTSNIQADISKILVKKKDIVKKPDTAYRSFAKEYSSKLKEKNPGLAFGEVTKKVAGKWKGMDEEQKEKYVDLAKQDKCRYVNEICSLPFSEEKKELMNKNGIYKLRGTYDVDEFYDAEYPDLNFLAASFISSDKIPEEKNELIDYIVEKQDTETYFLVNMKQSKKNLILISRYFGVNDISIFKKKTKKETVEFLQDIGNSEANESDEDNEGNEDNESNQEEKEYEEEEFEKELENEEEEEEYEDEQDKELQEQGYKKSVPFSPIKRLRKGRKN